MYNRYIPDTGPDHWDGADPEPTPPEEGKRGVGGLLADILDKSGANTLLRHLRLSQLDAGDVLVLVIAALLILDKEDIDLGIALILVFLLGFGDKDSPT